MAGDKDGAERAIIGIVVAVVLAIINTPPARAQEEVRTMTTTGGTSSECVGDPRTPLCAFDTWNACFLWSEPSLCEKVGLEGQKYREAEIGSSFEGELAFRQITVRPIEARHLAEIEVGRLATLRPEQEWLHPGYVDMRWTEQVCPYWGDEDCFTYEGEGVLIVKPVGDEWHVSGWRYGGDVWTCRDYIPARDDPWSRRCSLYIPTDEFLDYEASRRSAE